MSEYHSFITGLPVVLGHQAGRVSPSRALGGEAARRTTIPASKPVIARLFIFISPLRLLDLRSYYLALGHEDQQFRLLGASHRGRCPSKIHAMQKSSAAV